MKLGFFEALGGVDGNAAGDAATRDLGGSWDIVTDMAVKLVPGGHPYHALAEAAANAAREGSIAAAEAIESITVSRPGMTALTGPSHPKDLIDMAHSPAYFTAAGAADREFSWAHATPAKIADPVIHGADRQGAGRAAADRECRALPPGRDRDDPRFATGAASPARSTPPRVRASSASPGTTSTPSSAPSPRSAGSAATPSAGPSTSSTISAGPPASARCSTCCGRRTSGLAADRRGRKLDLKLTHPAIGKLAWPEPL